MNTRKGLAPIVLVIIAVLVLGGGYVAYKYTLESGKYRKESDMGQDSMGTREWKTYRNEKYGFEFKSPARKVALFPASSGDYLSGTREFYGIYGVSNQDYAARVDVYPATSLGIVLRDNRFVNTGTVSGKVVSNGISWTKVGNFDYLVEKNNATYHVAGDMTLTAPILSTFKFTDTSVPSSDIMTTFRNPEFGISFEYPTRYSVLRLPGQTDVGVLPLLEYKAPDKFAYDTIAVSWLPFKQGQNIEQVMVNNVVYDGSGAHPKSFDSFTLVHLGDNDFYKIRTGLFEGVLGYQYYLVRDSGAFVFTLTSSGVPWTDPSYDSEKDPRLLDLQEILRTVKLSN